MTHTPRERLYNLIACICGLPILSALLTGFFWKPFALGYAAGSVLMIVFGWLANRRLLRQAGLLR
jgi:hypothetical protein